MRTLAIGDIHGHINPLLALEQAVAFRPDDMLVTLGDYVDRGPNAAEVIDWLIHRNQEGQLIALRGNHEHMMLAAEMDPSQYQGYWLDCGGLQTLRSYSPRGDAGRLEDIPQEHWQFLQQTCRDYYETDTHIFVHANLYPHLKLKDQPAYMLFWEPFEDPKPHFSGRTMVCGHTAQRTGIPNNIGHAVCIDTWVYGPGWLTCLDVDTGDYWQANTSGELRRRSLQQDEEELREASDEWY